MNKLRFTLGIIFLQVIWILLINFSTFLHFDFNFISDFIFSIFSFIYILFEGIFGTQYTCPDFGSGPCNLPLPWYLVTVNVGIVLFPVLAAIGSKIYAKFFATTDVPKLLSRAFVIIFVATLILSGLRFYQSQKSANICESVVPVFNPSEIKEFYPGLYESYDDVGGSIKYDLLSYCEEGGGMGIGVMQWKYPKYTFDHKF